MVWLPDHIWEAQRGSKGKGKGGGGGSGIAGIFNLFQQLAKGMGKGNGKGKGQGKGLRGFKPECKVWIQGIADGTTWKELQDHMNQSGKTRWVEIFTGTGKGSGAVAYGSSEDAINAVAALNGSVLKGSALQCDIWQRKERDPNAAVEGSLGEFVGTIKSFSGKGGYGFIECPEVAALGYQNVFLPGYEIRGYRVGHKVTFTAVLSKDQKPQAKMLKSGLK